MDLEIQNCTHLNVYDNVCSNCGLCMVSSCQSIDLNDNYSNSNVKVKFTKNNYELELKDKDFPEEIKSWVYKISNKSENTIHKLSYKEKILFAYVYLAYLELEYNFDPIEIIEKLGMKKKDIKSGIKLASGMSSKILPQCNYTHVTSPLVIISPLFFVKEQLEKLDYIKYIDDITLLIEDLLNENQLLLEEKPNIVSLAVIKFYMINNLNINAKKNKIHIIFNIPLVSFNKCYNMIEKIIAKKNFS
jgi:hypothetical protein